MVDHSGHMDGACPSSRTKRHHCGLIDQLLTSRNVNDEVLRKAKQNGWSTLRDAGLAPFHGCMWCGKAAPDPTKEVRFYKSTGPFGFLSNLYKCDVVIAARTFSSSEHAYQFAKSSKPEISEWIAQAPHPRLAAQAAHSLSLYDIKREWKETKVPWMKLVVMEKFCQHPALAAKLLDTGDKTLIEDSKTDAFWGLGKRGDGKNMLGVILMETRSTLKAARADDRVVVMPRAEFSRLPHLLMSHKDKEPGDNQG